MASGNADRGNPHPGDYPAVRGFGPGDLDDHPQAGQEQPPAVTSLIQNLILQGHIKRFYKLKLWRKKRAAILKRDNRECQACKTKGKYSRATCVHHIKHLDKAPHLALADSNLTSLCYPCHNEEHPEKLRRYQVGRKEHITPERW